MREEEDLILNQIDNAIALFDSQQHLIRFNHKLTEIWGVPAAVLVNTPHFDSICPEIIAQGHWSAQQCQHLRSCLFPSATQGAAFCIEQSNGVCLEVYSILNSTGKCLLRCRDVTDSRNIQGSLKQEVRRLEFLLGLNERLQNSDNLQEIAQFALNYLIKVMNAAFGDVKVVTGEGNNRQAGPISNKISGQFVATYGKPAVSEMQQVLQAGISYGQGLLWQVVETGQPLFVQDYANHPQAVPGFRNPAIGQLGIFPIPATDGTIIGVLTLESRNLEQMQQYPQRDMLDAACRTLGTAIERAQAQERLRQINQDLERASQLKSEFLASMSHELRTPLNSIIGFSELLQRQISGELSERQLNQVQLITQSGQHLLQLINDILDLSKIEAGKTELSLQPVDIHPLCAECLKMIQPRADKKRLSLSLELDYRLTQAVLDPRRIRQIIINLLSNAVKFTPESGSIKLSGRLAYGTQILEGDYRPDCSAVNASTPYLCLEVQDSGIGIPQEKWPLLFRPFQQIDSSLSRRHDGTGLGLALTKRLAELHGGTVSLQSQVGQGSRFRVWLPLTEMRQELTVHRQTLTQVSKATASEVSENSTSSSAKVARILVVEDQPFNQLLLREILELEGYQVDLISEGRTLLEKIDSPSIQAETLPDLILMDIQLPEVDGFELMRHLKNHSLWQSVPVVAVTAMAMTGDRDRCLDAGAVAYLSKPLEVNQVLGTVQSILKK